MVHKNVHTNLACSQRQIHTVYTCKLSQAKQNYQKIFIPIKYKQPEREVFEHCKHNIAILLLFQKPSSAIFWLQLFSTIRTFQFNVVI